MMNFLGKSLVFVHVVLSLLALAWAAALFLMAADWGFKQPRLDVTERVPSELDKRMAATKQAYQTRDMVLPAVKRNQDQMFVTMQRYAVNHLFYRSKLDELKNAEGPIQAKEIKFQNGDLVLDVAEIGVPVMEADAAGVEKSYAQYRKELTDQEQGLYKQIQAVTSEVRDWIDKNKKVTYQLNGLDEAGKKAQLGLYDLLDYEAQLQAKLRFEKEYLQPKWARALEEAQLHEERRAALEQTLDRLKQYYSEKGK